MIIESAVAHTSVDFVSFFLALSLVLYALFGGADFGAGILELTSNWGRNKDRRLSTYKAIGPVWEANHIWLIIAVVILFVAFPGANAEISTYLHIPLSLVLFGIVVRGSAFTFRHYDAITDKSQEWYSWLFMLSSLWTSFFLGVCAGAVLLGHFPAEPETFYESFISPWLHMFPFSVGLFFCSLCSMLASTYMIGEVTRASNRAFYAFRARISCFVSVFLGSVVFLSAELHGLSLISRFLNNPIGLSAIVLATLSLFIFFRSLKKFDITYSRIWASGLMVFVLVGWFSIQYPYLVSYSDNSVMTFYEAAAPKSTLTTLLIVLTAGVSIVMPFFGYLLWVFKRN